MKKRFLSALILLALLAAGGSARAQDVFSNFLSPQDEAAMGREQHEKILKEFGGAYADPALNRYVASIGEFLGRTSERPDQRYTLTILNSPIVNAFALPGGYVYVTRGLLALADNEAEVAGVIAHEIGHVTARHASKRYGRTTAAQLGVTLLDILTKNKMAGQAAGLGANLFLQSYSRDEEFEADQLGVRNMARAGFAPQAMSQFLSRLEAHDSLQSQIRGQKGAQGDPLSGLLSTHPRTADRVARAIEAAQIHMPANPGIDRDIYLSKIDGLLYGDDPKEGFVRGLDFIHPQLGLRFSVPAGFVLNNGEKAVVAEETGGARIVFDLDERKNGRASADYLQYEWGKGIALRDLEMIRVNNLRAATARTQSQGPQGPLDVRLLVLEFSPQSMARFLFISPAPRTQSLNDGFRRTTYSFRQISPQEVSEIRPQQVTIVTPQPGDTVESLAARTPFADYKVERFRVLNGLGPNAPLSPGQKVKLVQ